MASERRLKATASASIAAMLALAGSAGYCYALASPRLSVLCLLLALAPAWLLCRCLAPLAPRLARQEPAMAAAASHTPQEQEELLRTLEACLEHAPIALFRIRNGSAERSVTPLNASARRQLAPGHASVPQRWQQLLAAQPPGQRSLLSFDTERGVERALVAVAALTLQGAPQHLAALMPVESELEAEALNAWRELVQVLTHEIMNSLTPVASLSLTARDLLADVRPLLPHDVHADLATALDAIARRAASLADFVASYRSLSSVPAPQPEAVCLEQLFQRLQALLAPAWQARGGSAEFSVEPASLEVRLDAGQLEQALINLLKNAAEATQDCATPRVTVSARLSRGARLRIEVRDNGHGVPDALAAHIFMPFFSTRKQGRGIGLALVRHLAHANGGTLRHARPVGAGACFLLCF